MPLATPEDLLARKRAALVHDLVADDGVALSPAEVRRHPALLAALGDADAAILAALAAGKRYLPSELDALPEESRALLVRIACDLAAAFLMERNPARDPQETARAREVAEDWLAQLREGTATLPGSEAEEAGLPTVDGPTTLDYDRLNLLPDRVRNYFPARSGRLPKDRL